MTTVFTNIHTAIEDIVTRIGPQNFLKTLNLINSMPNLIDIRVIEVEKKESIANFIRSNVSSVYGIEVSKKTKNRLHCEAKMVLAYLLREYCQYTILQIAKFMGYNSTQQVWSYLRQMQDFLELSDNLYTTLKGKYKSVKASTDLFIRLLDGDNSNNQK